MVEVIENQEFGTYVVKGIEGEPSIPKEYFEGDKPYEIIKAFGYRYYENGISNKELNEFLQYIKEEKNMRELNMHELFKLFNKIDPKAYLYVLDHLGIVNFSKDKLTVLRETPPEVSDEKILGKILDVYNSFLLGRKKSTEELGNTFDNESKPPKEEEEMSKKVNTRMKYHTDMIKKLETEKNSYMHVIETKSEELSEELIEKYKDHVLELKEEIKGHNAAISFMKTEPITNQIRMLTRRASTGASICQTATIYLARNIKAIETLKGLKSLPQLVKIDWMQRIIKSTIAVVSPFPKIIEALDKKTKEEEFKEENEAYKKQIAEKKVDEDLVKALSEGNEAEIAMRQKETELELSA